VLNGPVALPLAQTIVGGTDDDVPWRCWADWRTGIVGVVARRRAVPEPGWLVVVVGG